MSRFLPILVVLAMIAALVPFAIRERRARRNERQVYAEKWMRAGIKHADRRGLIQDDYRHRLARFGEDCW